MRPYLVFVSTIVGGTVGRLGSALSDILVGGESWADNIDVCLCCCHAQGPGSKPAPIRQPNT
eukprot:4068946-Amphidinium_carterae.1